MAVKSGTVYCLTSHIQPLPAKNEPIRYKWSKKSRLVLWSFANYHMLTKGLRRECMNEAKMIRLSCCRPSIHTCQVTLLYFTLRTMGALCRTKTHQANWVFTFTTKKTSEMMASPVALIWLLPLRLVGLLHPEVASQLLHGSFSSPKDPLLVIIRQHLFARRALNSQPQIVPDCP